MDTRAQGRADAPRPSRGLTAGRYAPTITGRITGAAVSFYIRTTAASTVPSRCVQVEPSGRPSVRVDKDGNFTDGVCG